MSHFDRELVRMGVRPDDNEWDPSADTNHGAMQDASRVYVVPRPSTSAPAMSIGQLSAFRREQDLEFSQYLYDLNEKAAQARPKGTIKSYFPKQDRFKVSLFQARSDS